MVSALDRKLLRDLKRMRGQALTIALVMAVGIACFIALRGNYASLLAARAAYYQSERFADVFAHLERAPESVAQDLEALDGVARVQTRVVEAGMIPLPGVAQPIRAQLVSLPGDGQPALNAVQLRKGRMLTPHKSDEALLLEAFATAHGIEPGDQLDTVINGNWRTLSIVGIVKSPEYVVAFSPGDLAPTPGRFAVLWLDREVLAATFRMEGAFNDVTLALQPGASLAAVVAAVDRVLEPYGGVGALGRDKQPSSFFVNGELMQLDAMSTWLPGIFLAVAALLINIVLSRTVHLQRPEIATLKAVGYSDLDVGLHFSKLVGVIAVAGSAIGVGIGIWLGQQMVGLYRQFFDFPNLHFVVDGSAAATGVVITLGAAALGALLAIRRVVMLPPAEAMRPAAPARYRRSLIDRLGIGTLISPAAQMVVRELERQPIRSAMSALAIASSVGLMVVGAWYYDGIDSIMHTQFHEAMREDLAVTFRLPTDERAVRELAHLPGVIDAEGLRVVPVRFHHAHRYRDGSIFGYPDDIEMRALRNSEGDLVPLPPDGIVLTDMLGDVLGVGVGDRVEVKVNDGERGRHQLVVTGLVRESFGLQGHMRLEALRDTLGEDELVSLALLRVDPVAGAALDERLKELPGVLSVNRRMDALEQFREQSGGMIIVVALIITLFAATITIGVVYNNARVALSLRSRDLASLRVLGFHRSEISAVLLGELAVQVLVALPFGLLFGTWLCHALAQLVDPETYRLPVILTPRSYAFAAAVAIAASAVSALLVRRKLDHLDLVAVLKARE